MEENKFKEIIAANISECRKQLNLTQFELASKLNYSDKSISKWERGEAVPDAFVLKQLADLFGITVDLLMTESAGKKTLPAMPAVKKKIIIPLLSTLLVFFVATVVYGFLVMFAPNLPRPWISFIIALPAASIVLIVFSKLFIKKLLVTTFISTLSWSVALLLFLLIKTKNNFVFFIIAAAFQIIIFLWHFLRQPKKLN